MGKYRTPKASLDISRRIFLHRSAVMLGGVLLAGPALAAKLGCRPTASDILGPFYRFGAPFRARLAGPDELGDRLVLTGTVFGSDCRTPLPGALIEVWQANHAGLYDTNKPGNFTEVTSFHLRGMLYTNEKGQYEVETIMPGRYPVPPNLPGLEKYAGLTRPAHIHMRVMESLHIPLTMQLYFKGDPFIANDPWAGKKPSLAIDLKQDGKLRRGVFDVVLARGL
ncbi:twin-arginine translocation pathway signal protein [Crenobacter cavernae]|uniref:Twin-arginine translocation pathway signal protein n=1 Tax=Crenobacter cavernae TaxID=2290923 RepID=A0A345Y4V9_9NEIS|nr:twin-arginine translocation pathway signal protein [Crenobacter cavernae]AXK38961.1 twin-arginine translocation pathway signal protein [Crenobacter cavernae]